MREKQQYIARPSFESQRSGTIIVAIAISSGGSRPIAQMDRILDRGGRCRAAALGRFGTGSGADAGACGETALIVRPPLCSYDRRFRGKPLFSRRSTRMSADKSCLF